MTRPLYYNLSRACLFTVLLIWLQQAGLTQADYERTCSIDHRPHPRGLCGSRLADTVQNLCATVNANHFNRGIVKRSAEKAMDDSLKNIMLYKEDALSYLSKRVTSGSIVCECCYHQCTVFELIEYCDLPAHMINRQGM